MSNEPTTQDDTPERDRGEFRPMKDTYGGEPVTAGEPVGASSLAVTAGALKVAACVHDAPSFTQQGVTITPNIIEAAYMRDPHTGESRDVVGPWHTEHIEITGQVIEIDPDQVESANKAGIQIGGEIGTKFVAEKSASDSPGERLVRELFRVQRPDFDLIGDAPQWVQDFGATHYPQD
jgi:hypothetical protein